MKQIKLLIAFSVILLITLSIAGCYTMLSHPTVIEDNESSEYENYAVGESIEIDYSHDCLQCHSTQNHVYINRFYNHHYESEDHPVSAYYWDYAPRAHYYYSSPWWLSDYYYSAAVPMQRDKSDEALPRPSDFSRRPSSPAYPGSASMSSGNSAVGAVRATSSSSSSGSSSDAEKPSPSTRRPAKTKSESSGTSKSDTSTRTKTKSKTKNEKK